jgi:predicted CXXCH cytochrome family protein
VNLALIHSAATTTTAQGTLTSCAICHATGRTPSATCTDCHNTAAPHANIDAAHTTTASACSTGTNCHDVAPGDVRTLHKNVCEDCHDAGKTPSTDCATCHGSNTAYSHGYQTSLHSANPTGTITIDGTSFDDIVCASCHNASSITSTNTVGTMALGSLHDNSCASCHPTVVPNVVSTWNKSCDQVGCHSPSDNTNLDERKPQHTGIDAAHSMVPVAKDCLAGGACHSGTGLPMIHANAKLTENGTTYTGCQVCHKNSLNVPVVPDFTSPDGSVWQNECLGCHQDRWVQHGYTSQRHASTVTTESIVSNGVTINNIVCADCHARGTVTTDTPSGTMELGPIHSAVGLGCDNCHPTPRDTFTTWNKTCDEPGCHGATSTQPTHAVMNSAHTPTEGTSCMIDGCHLGDTTAPGWGTDLPQIHQNATTTVDGQLVKGCLVCHFNNGYDPNGTGTTFATDANGIPNTKECATCHPQGNNTMHAYSFANHTSAPASQTITIGSTTWPQMACSRCHFTELSSEHARNISGFKSKGCFNCHPNPYSSLEAQGQAIGGWNKGCSQADCHAPASASAMHASVTASHTPLPQNNSCFSGTACHTNDGETIADIHSQATTTVAGVVRTQCDVCHGDFAKQSQPPSANCTYCHANKLVNGQVASHVNTDTLHPSASVGSCASDNNSCHFGTLAKEHFRWTPTAGGSFTCETCHSSTDPTVVNAIKNKNSACDACHATHHGTQTPSSNQSCQDCHGTTSTEISSVATSGVYANTGGDHKTGFAESAHASIQTTPTVGDAATTIQCTVCHNHERKNVGKYVDYRYTGWPDPQQNHEDLCFQCHTSTTTVVNEPNKPNTWNGRSVQSQFQLVSKHTISTGSGSFVDQEIPNFTETTQAQFNLETRTNVVTTNVSGGEVKLGQDVSTGVNPPAVTNLLFAKLGGATTMDQYSTADNAWNGSNAAKFSPAAAPGSPAAGASAFRLPGDSKIYFPTASTCYVYTPPADPTADSWTTVPNMGAGAALGAGGDTAVNTTGTATTGQCVYYLRGGSSNYIYMKPYAGSATAAAGRVQYPSGTALNQGAGSAIAFAPNSNRTFIINRNGAAGDGRLYYTSTLNRPTGTATAYVLTQGPSMTTSSTASTVYNRLTAATIGGTDYLFSVGPNYAGSLTLQVVTNVASTPTLLGIGIKPPTGWTSTGDGCDLKYNSADGYLYAIRGGATTSFSRIQVPANPGTASSWTGVNWQALTTQTAQTAGSSIEFANADAPTITPFKFFSAGTFATSSDVNKLAGAARWGNLTFNGAVPANTAMSFKVEGYNSGTGLYDTLVSAGVTSPIDLTSYDCTTYPKVRLTATLSTNDPFNTLASPQLNDWSVSNIKQTYVPPSGSLIQCENCHNTHLVQKGTGGWDKSRVVDPSNVKQLWTGTWADFCLKCHTGAADGSSTQTYAPMISATSIIPYNVAFRPISNPFFSGFSKTTTGMDWASAGHNPANGSEQSGFSQTTQAEFTSDTLNQTVASNVSGGEVKLAQNPNGQPNPVAQSGVAFVNAGGTANFDQYLFDSWNTTNTLLAGTPTNVPASSATGASSFKIPGDNSIYVMSGSTTYQYTPGVDPSTDSWTTNANLVPQQAQSLGADTAVNSASKVIYTTRSGGRNTIYTRLYTSPYTASNMTFSAGSLGAGSSIAYAPTADRLFVLYKNGTTSATGQLFYLAAPGVKTGAQTFTAGPQLAPSGTTSVISRMDVVTTGGADYLFYLGPNASNALSFQVVSNLGSTPATAALPIPTGWTTVADGCDLEYNAADGYIYAIRGGTVGFARIKVPATPATVGSWGTWQTLSQIRPWGAGTTLSFADVDPVPGGTYTLYGSGTVTSPDISAPANSTKWGNLTFTSATPANTALSVTVMGYNSGTSTWDTLIPATSVSPTSLKVYSASLYTKLRLVGNLSTTALTTKASNPEIDDWAVTAYAPSTNSPSCNNCHDPHGSNNPSLVAYSSLNGATVRDNSTAVQGSGLCYKCHGTGSGLDMDVQAPATAAYGHPVAASATKHVDTESIASLATNRHADCSDCHNPHSGQKGTHVALSTSNGAPVLYGAIGVSPTFATGVAANFTTATALTPVTFKSTSSTPEAYLCLKCHAGSGTSLTPVTTTSGTYTRTDLAQEFNPANASYHNVLGQATGTKTTFTNFVNAAGTTFSQTWPIPSASGALTNGLNWNSKITCSDCHTGGAGAQAAGPHGSSAKWMLDPAYPTDWETVTYTNRTASAYICRKCHDMSVTTNSGAHGGNHNNALCIQCHIAVPHGWKRPRLLVYTTDPAPYWKLGASGGLVAVSSTMSHTAASSISWSQNDCGATGTQPTGGTSCSSHGNSTMTAKWK